MKKLRILLYADAVGINNKSKGYFKFLVPILDQIKKFFIIEEIWIGPTGGYNSKKYVETIIDYDLFIFHDGLELIQELKPDLVLMTSREYISQSLLIAAKFEGIKSVLVDGDPLDNNIHMRFKKLLFIRARQFLNNNKIFFKKYIFLIRTMLKTKHNLSNIINIIFKDIKFHLTSFTAMEIQNIPDLYICPNLEIADDAIRLGTDKNKIFVAGDYALDYLYDDFLNFKHTSNEKIEILFITTGLVGHGDWSYNQYKISIINVVNSLKSHFNKTVNMRFKIHPLAEKIETYQKILANVDPSIQILQNENLFSTINNADLIVTFAVSSALTEAIMLKKPILFLNFYGEHFQMVKDGVAKECKNTDELISIIQNASFSKINFNAYEKYVERKIYKFDGKCGERAANKILSLFKN